MEAKATLYKLIKSRRLIDNGDYISEALGHFRYSYSSIGLKYPGDSVFYKAYQNCILNGLTIRQTYFTIFDLIAREIGFRIMFLNVGIQYIEEFSIET